MGPGFKVGIWNGWASPHEGPHLAAPSDFLTLQTTTVQNPMLSVIICPGTLLEEPHLNNRSASFLKLQDIGSKNWISSKLCTYVI